MSSWSPAGDVGDHEYSSQHQQVVQRGHEQQLQLTASGTGHRGRLPAVSSTTAPHNTVFTITG
ncbi:hypothetical protein, partial [Streptomyces prunicolor]|uniref:hypothetical protein n=1 Tax=Streptomyces prunicolor TaxID=67348 RepID=UPI0034034EE9